MSDRRTDRADASVVVCTIGRLGPLERCLASLREQTVAPVEIVVVLASTDPEAEAFLAGRPDVRVVRVDRLNLCMSRNAGVRAARGRIVAFCDDDAVCKADWLEQLIEPFADPAVGGAAGKVFDSRVDPPTVAFKNGIIRLSGRQEFVRPEPGDYNDPRGPWYNGACGCNCAFRRDALRRIGGFDEFMEFGYDETDVCVRLIRAGYRIAHVPEAVVHHGYAPGGHRTDDLVRNWHAEIKNHLHFGLKNRRGGVSAWRTLLRVLARAAALELRFARAVMAGRITARQARRFSRDLWAGLLDGMSGYRRRCRPADTRPD